MNRKQENFKEKFKQALISTAKVISDDYLINTKSIKKSISNTIKIIKKNYTNSMLNFLFGTFDTFGNKELYATKYGNVLDAPSLYFKFFQELLTKNPNFISFFPRKRAILLGFPAKMPVGSSTFINRFVEGQHFSYSPGT